jgi:eukaryotic-like serine/threonine-protein kinase
VPRFQPAVQKIGDFVIDRELGRGSMGIVYHAVQQSTGREVALKLIQPAATKPEAMQLFLREVQLLDQLRTFSRTSVTAGCK